MFQTQNIQTTAIFPTILGSFVILLALFNRQLLQFIMIKPLSEVFTTPRLQRSAKVTEKLGVLFLAIFGIGFLVQGIGPQFLSNKETHTISITILGLSGLIFLVAVGVVLANWKAK
jgi:hypothetical protein